jgi:hypothetical protein
MTDMTSLTTTNHDEGQCGCGGFDVDNDGASCCRKV